MLEPIESPLECFGLEHSFASEVCQACAHREGCQELTGYRLHRIPLDHAHFDLIPKTVEYRRAERETDERDIEAIYAEMYRQVFACDPLGSVGKFKDKVIATAIRARSSIPMFILTCMYAHATTYPEQTFTPGLLVDGRALGRVKLYAEACRAKYAAFDIHALSRLTKIDLDKYDLRQRMLASEILAGRWIVEFKLENAGKPFQLLFEELEPQLDPNWLAIEPNYEEVIKAHALRADTGGDQETRHLARQTFTRLKKHKHQAISNYRAREAVVVQALRHVLGELYYEVDDFELPNEPVKDVLHIWNRLGIAIQHMECLKFVQLGKGVFASSS